MFTVKTFQYDCTRKCRCRQHGNAITAALTKRAIDDEKLAAFIAKTCCNFCDAVDDLGRSAVHLAASVGRYAILEWLLNQDALINGRDFESGSSPLHRAIYYGCIDCAVLLLRYGASLELLDDNTRCALQSICRKSDIPSKPERVRLMLRSAIKMDKTVPSNEILVWGSNKNYNLGIGNEEGTGTPQSIDFFRKQNISIETAALGTYHSLFLDKKSVLYAVGHGKGGRLGIGIENSLPAPTKVKVAMKNAGEVIIDISVSRKHSLLLTDHSVVFACGLNEDQQLGVRGAGAKLTVFKEVVTLRDLGVTDLKHVIARDCHSLVYSPAAIYVWGSNHGQMNISGDTKVVPIPKQVKLAAGISIQFVEANNFATAIYTNDVYTVLLLHNFKTKLLKIPNFEVLKSMCLVGGDNSSSGKGSVSALKLLLLTQTNVIFVWYDKTQSFYRCIFSHININQIDKIFYKSNQVLILSQGDVYRGKCHQVAVPNIHNHDGPVEERCRGNNTSTWTNDYENRTALSKDYMIRIDLHHLPTVDRALNIYSDDDFASFGVLQESSMKYFKLPALVREEYTFKKLLNDASESDMVHDVVFHVDGETFVAHKLLMYARAPGLKELIVDSVNDDKNVYFNFSLLSGKMFEIILKYIYTNYFPNEDDLDAIQQSLGPESPAERMEICLLLLEFVEKFQLKDLANYLRICLKSLLDDNSFPYAHNLDSKYPFKRLRRNDFSELHDVRITCADGVEVAAHKCVLVTNLEYFDMMFRHSWAEQTSVSLCTVPAEYMEPIVDFLYSSDVDQFCKQQYTEAFLYNMIVFCDQFFIDRLRNLCEILILDKINLRKCGAMLDFATTYNCEVLKKGCLEFICQNLARVLMYKSLDSCEPEALKCLNTHYREMFKEVFDYRLITPDSEAVEDELLLSFVDDFEVDLGYRKDDQEFLVQKTANAKQKDNKIKQSARQYEREAISSMIASMQLSDGMDAKKVSESERNKVLDEAKIVAERLQAESKAWMKVVDKKEQHKKKLSAEKTTILPANDLLEKEDKFGALQAGCSKSEISKTGVEETTIATTAPICSTATVIPTSPTTPTKMYHVNLAELTTSREKTSQKQRKRLSAELNRAAPAAATPPRAETIKTPPTPPTVPNAWGISTQEGPTSPLTSAISVNTSPTTGSSADTTSFANMARTGAISKREKAGNNFSKIMAEERQQREDYERMRSKSLLLTQIEETAIAELRQFYNVENVYDEVITIERKSRPATINFAVWQRN